MNPRHAQLISDEYDEKDTTRNQYVKKKKNDSQDCQTSTYENIPSFLLIPFP